MVGALWTQERTTFPSWEVDLSFRISGRGKRGGDGIAFWFVEQKPPKNHRGSLYGGIAGDEWKGLGIFFDSYDIHNEGPDGAKGTPTVNAMVNDGTIKYDWQK